MRGTRVWATLALVIAGGFVVSPTAAADGDCQGEGGVERYVEMDDPVTFETGAHGEYTIAAYTPSDEPGLYHYWWTTFECGHVLDVLLECLEQAEPSDPLDSCRS